MSDRSLPHNPSLHFSDAPFICRVLDRCDLFCITRRFLDGKITVRNALLGALLERFPPEHPASEVYFLLQEPDVVPLALDALADKGSVVRESAQYAVDALFANMSAEALVAGLMPVLLKYLEKRTGKWQGTVGALALLGKMADKAKMGNGSKDEPEMFDGIINPIPGQLYLGGWGTRRISELYALIVLPVLRNNSSGSTARHPNARSKVEWIFPAERRGRKAQDHTRETLVDERPLGGELLPRYVEGYALDI